MNILLTNDDGIDAAGISTLYDEMVKIGDVNVVAPVDERSAAAHSVSVLSEFYVEKRYRNEKLWGYGVDATPADCVKVALSTSLGALWITENNRKPLPEEKPDIIIAGINRGANVGTNILYSGTVAAAMEGRLNGIPSIALSINSRRWEQPHFETAANFARKFVPVAMNNNFPNGVFLNINVPNVPADKVKGVIVTRMSMSYFIDDFAVQKRLKGESEEEKYHILLKNVGEKFIHFEDGSPDFDDIAVKNNYISITPLHYNLTYTPLKEKISGWLKEM